MFESKQFSKLVIVCLLMPLAPAAFGEDATRYLIVNTDDSGMSHAVNLATIKAMEEGAVSSSSIMVPCPWFPEIAAYAKAHPEKDFGIHLTLTSEWDHYRWAPVTSKDKVPSLVDEQGYFWDNSELVAKHVKASEVEIELRAQIDRAKQFGVPVTHLDTHMGSLLSRADLAKIYVKMGVEYNLPIRMAHVPKAELRRERPALAPVVDELIAALKRNGLPVLDAIDSNNYGIPPQEKKAYYLKYLRALKPGITEIIIHCGLNNAELRGATASADRRGADTKVFTNPQVISEIKSMGIQIITWKQAHAMAKAKK